jgi:hypothetical protein
MTTSRSTLDLARRALRMAQARWRPGQPAESPAPAGEAIEALSPEDRPIVESALPYTMTGVPRLQALIDAVRYVERRGIAGHFVECGVWRGGSVLAMIETLRRIGAPPRHIWLYDTFEGMTEPTDRDTSRFEPPALETWQEAQTRGQRPWHELFGSDVFSDAAVRATLLSTGYSEDHLHFVTGPVEQTLPGEMPDGALALLRLDTDWYESTRHELTHLYPPLAPGGVLIVDDYGHFEGARQAVDEYFEVREPLLLNRIDYTGRIAVKV